MLQLFDSLSWSDILIGPDQEKIQTMQRTEGIEYGLESFFVSFILTYGLVVSLMFFVGLAAFCADVVRASRPRAWTLFLFFFLVASTSVILSAKTCTFGMFVALTLLMLPVLLGEEEVHSMQLN